MRALACACLGLMACGRSSLDLGQSPADAAVAPADAAPAPAPARSAPEPPRNVQATRDLPGEVEVSFDPPLRGQPTEYRVLRDGLVVATLPAHTHSWRDAEAEPGWLGPPTGLQASQGTHADRIELRWSAPTESHPGPSHRYVVVALEGDVSSAPSESSVGRRAAPEVTHYEWSADGEQTWSGLPYASTHYVDRQAPAAWIEPGDVFLDSMFVPAGMVRMEVHASAWSRGDVYYRVRAVTAEGPGESSLAALGFRAAPDAALRYQWQRSVSARGEVFEDLQGATGPSWFDASLPPDTERHYRVRVSLGPETSVVSAPATVRTRPPVLDAALHGATGCVITEAMRLHCWGTDAVHALNEPFTQVSTAYGRICALQPDGRRRCWGGPADSYAPSGPSSTAYQQIALASDATCGIRAEDQRVECRSVYPFAPAPEGAFVEISADYDGVSGIRTDGSLAWSEQYDAWDLGSPEDVFVDVHHQSGRTWAVRSDGSLLAWPYPSATPITPVGSEDLRFTATTTRCGLTEGGALHCWPQGPERPGILIEERRYRTLVNNCGIRSDGRVDCGDALRSNPLPLQRSGTGVLMLRDQACLLDEEDRLHCPRTPRVLEALEEDARPTRVRAIIDRYGQACALHPDGRLQCWETSENHGPQRPELPDDERYSAVVDVLHMICGLRLDSRLRCVQSDDVGLAPPALSEHGFVQLVGGYGHVCALDEERRLQCWGTGPAALPPPSATEFPVRAMASGNYHVCVVREDHQLVCWGDDSEGQAPRGPRETELMTLAAGFSHTCGLTEEGAVQCWGDTPSWGPPSLGRYRAIAAEGATTCGLRDDGKLVCWGPGHRAEDGRAVVTP